MTPFREKETEMKILEEEERKSRLVEKEEQ